VDIAAVSAMAAIKEMRKVFIPASPQDASSETRPFALAEERFNL
jgi:hypothetical protein